MSSTPSRNFHFIQPYPNDSSGQILKETKSLRNFLLPSSNSCSYYISPSPQLLWKVNKSEEIFHFILLQSVATSSSYFERRKNTLPQNDESYFLNKTSLCFRMTKKKKNS